MTWNPLTYPLLLLAGGVIYRLLWIAYLWMLTRRAERMGAVELEVEGRYGEHRTHRVTITKRPPDKPPEEVTDLALPYPRERPEAPSPRGSRLGPS